MSNYEQIKSKELPDGMFISATYYPSGNVEFVSEEIVAEANDEFEGCDDCLNCAGNEICWKGYLPNEIFGTKHIQLIAANPKVHLYRYEVDFSFGTEQREEYGFFNISELGYPDDRCEDKDTFWIDNEVANDEIIEKELIKLSKKQYDLAKSLEKGKDFFIYKATDIKGELNEQ